MEKFIDYTIQRKKLITHEDLIELGWTPKGDITLTYEKRVYEKDNYWVCFFEQEGHQLFSVVAIDPLKIQWLPHTPENFRIILKHPTLEAFKIIMAFI